MNVSPVRIAIWGSGSGSNAQKIVEYFKGREDIEVGLMVSDQPEAYILKRAEQFEIPGIVLDEGQRRDTLFLLHLMKTYHIRLVVLAGYMRKVNPGFLKAFPGPVLNIHPALLPAHGGQGMYGHRVHEAVIASGDQETGITIHFVNEAYDEGEIIYQEKISISPEWDAEQLGKEVLKLEHRRYPEIIEKIAKKITG
jgi:phosphoribosylglycinamide formyltransferase-1